MKTWIVTANASRARIFAPAPGSAALTEIADLAHPESRTHSRDLSSDLPGRSFDSRGPGRHALAAHTPPQAREAMAFADQLADHLNQARKTGALERLYLFAAPHLLGALRARLDARVEQIVVGEEDADLTLFSLAELRQRLPATL